jgi:heme/copper-type cytochrome/quinol oxidase subunit 4
MIDNCSIKQTIAFITFLFLKKYSPGKINIRIFIFLCWVTPLYGALWLGKDNIYNLPLSKKSKME